MLPFIYMHNSMIWKSFDVTIYLWCSVIMLMKMVNFGKQTGLTV